MYPEEGRSAIAAAARAIADFRLGRLDDETTANVGVDRAAARARTSSPSGARSRPRRARTTSASSPDVVAGDARGRDVRGEPRRVRRRDRARATTTAAIGSATTTFPCSSRSRRSSGRDHDARLETPGGAADANVFNARGLQCLNLANGMADIHTPDEHIAVDDLDAMVEVTLALIDAARDVEPQTRSRHGDPRASTTSSSGSRSTARRASPTRG